MKYGIVGGGILGLALAYDLTQSGADVIVFEGKDRPGGLLQFFQVDGAWIDKYYHCILASDSDLLALAEEIGLKDQIRFAPTRQGVFRDGQLYSMASGKDFLLFPPLNPVERFRLGLTILQALMIKDVNQVESVGVEADNRYFLKRARLIWNIRELLAISQAIWDVYVARPLPVLGPSEPIIIQN